MQEGICFPAFAVRYGRKKGRLFIKKSGTYVQSSRKESRQLSLMTVPVVLWYALFCYLPLFGIFFAFKDFTPVPGESLLKNLFVNSP